MPRLNAADALHWGSLAVENAYLGETMVWGVLSVPINTGSPTLSEAGMFVGDTVTTTTGTWSHSPTSYAYQWQEWDGDSWENIGGATSNSYTPVATGEYRARVIATNAHGDSAPAYSASVEAVEAPEGLVFTQGYRTNRVANVATCTGGSGQVCHAWTDGLSGKLYYEVQVSDPQDGDGRGGAYARDTLADPGTSAGLGQYFSHQSFGATGGEWSNAAYANEAYVNGGSPNLSMDPVRVFGFALDVPARRIWVRQVWTGGASAWWGAGSPDPATNTDPTGTFSGSEVIRAGMTGTDGIVATFLTAGSHYGAAPSGFTAV